MTLRVWSDYACPYAYEGHRRLQEALARRGLTLAVVDVRPFELHPERPWSRLALHAAEHARDAGCFEEVHDRLFRASFESRDDLSDPGVIAGIGADVGLDPGELVAAVTSWRYVDRIVDALEDAMAHGVTGTPSYLLGDGTVLRGVQPVDVLAGAL